MFNNRRIKKLEEQIYNLADDMASRQFDSYKSCCECGGTFSEDKMQKVLVFDHIFTRIVIDATYDHFCKFCKKPYDIVDKTEFPIRYYKKVEVNEKGVIIK